uniref:Carbonyl reductase n=1 Tax=Timema douglasi TaxID=61478 RepID=A0A7R8VEE4_TIMDO|nr:unnamed protein product [Timema douglasi]
MANVGRSDTHCTTGLDKLLPPGPTSSLPPPPRTPVREIRESRRQPKPTSFLRNKPPGSSSDYPSSSRRRIQLQRLGLKPNFHQLDVSDINSINTFRDYLQNKYGGLDVLINNAAIAYKHSAPEPFGEQAENTQRVNYFNLLDVCHSLFPLLRPHARVVNVSSSMGHLTKIPDQEIRNKFASSSLTEEELSELVNQFIRLAKKGEHTKYGWPDNSYSVSKVAVSALTIIQQRAFDQDSREDLVVNSVHPGYVKTDMTGGAGYFTTERGAEAPVYLALLGPNISSPKGSYVWHDKKIVDWVHGPVPEAV